MPRPERVPLSFAQQRMWFINQFDPSVATYNVPAGLRLTGEVDLRALEQAFGDMLTRHEVLRTRYPSDAEGPHQEIVEPEASSALFDWAPADSTQDLARAAMQGFDVAVELPIRARYRVVASGVTEVLVVVHHIAFDGESIPVFLRDLLAAYLHRTNVEVPAAEPLHVQYADFAIWQRRVLDDRSGAASPLAGQLDYWRDQLADLPAVTDLPMDRPRPQIVDQSGGAVTITLDDRVADGLAALARTAGVTPFMVGHAALAITIARLASTVDVVIGSPIAGRGDRALDDLVGMFVNTLVLRTGVDPAQPVSAFLADVRDVDVDAFAHADVPFDDLIDELDTERNTSYPPLVQITYTYATVGGRPDLAPIDLPGFSAEPLTAGDPVAKFELIVGVSERTDSTPMTAEFVYATSLFDEATVARFAQVWRTVLGHMVTDPQRAIGDIVLSEAIDESVLPLSRNSVGATGPAADGGVTDPVPLVEVLAARPTDLDHPALICAGATVSYREFEERTNRIARALIDAGAGPDDVVAIGLERSIDSVVAVFGVIKSGAAYVPVDPAYPQDRIDYMLTDSAVRLGITNAQTRPRLGSGEWLLIDDLIASGHSDRPLTPADRRGPVRIDSLAYLVYTSGSTGRPKAVGVSNRGLAKFIDQFREVTGAHHDNPDARVLHVSSPSFDASVAEMMWALGLGHTLVIAPAAEYAGEALGRVLTRDEVTDMVITPTVLGTVDPAAGGSVRNLVTAGEAISPELISRWTATHAALTMYNFYGPSEATVWASTGRSEADRPVTIGLPVRGFAAYVLDTRLHPVAHGVVGELYLASDSSLARGYLGRRGLTATSFVADPFSATPGARMYATGDIVRVNGDGLLEFAGRADDQVKINGQRIELGEVEAVLTDLDGVDAAVVIGVRDAADRDRLAAYVVPLSGADLTPEDLLRQASGRLAAHMVPHSVVILGELPLTPVGKLDRKALPSADFRAADDDYVAPETSTEQTLAAIIASLLGLERVSVLDSFFALGGDSIMSIQLASAARANALDLTPREIFEHRTVRAMAQAVDADRRQVPMLAEPSGGGTGEMAATPLTRWLIEATSGTGGNIADFNQGMVLIAPDQITAADLAELLGAVVTAHPMLSARLHRTVDEWSLAPGSAFDATAAVSERIVDAAPGTPEFDDAVRAADTSAGRRLDPLAGKLIQVELVRGDGGGRIVVLAHHLAVDAVSWPILVEDFFTGWAQHAAGQPIGLRSEQTSARSWFAALAERENEDLAFWAAGGRQGVTDLGTGAQRPVRWSATSEVVVTVPAEIADAVLTTVPEAFGGNVDDVLLGGLARAVRSWQTSRGIADAGPVVVLSEGHGRYEDVLDSGPDPRRADLSRTVGWFTSVAPLAVDPGVDVVHAVKAAKEERLALPAHGIDYGFARFGAADPAVRPSLPSIGFNYLGGRGGRLDEATDRDESADAQSLVMVPATDAPALSGTVDGAFDLMTPLSINASAVASERGTLIRASFRFPADLAEDSVADLGARWTAELAELVRTVEAGHPGLSPSDVPGAMVGQEELDELAVVYPGADVWSLSPLQRGLYFHSSFAMRADQPDVYIIQALLAVRGELDLDRLRRSAQELVAAHPVLRSAFVTTPSGALVAAVPPTVEVPWRVIDLGDVSETERAAQIRELKRRDALERFDLTAPPLLRFTVVRHGATSDLLVTAHHLVADGWSSPLVLADLLALYTVGATYTQQSAQSAGFKDYLRYIADRDQAEGLDAWQRILAPAEGPTLVAQGAHAEADALPAALAVPVDPALAARLDGVARDHGVTVSTVLQLAWAVFLSKLTANRIVTFGETVSGRPAELAGIDSVVGLFINTLPVVVDVDPDLPLTAILERLQRDKIAVLDHHYIGLPEIVAAGGGHIGFDTLMVHESYPVNAESLQSSGGELAGTVAIDDAVFTDSTHYPLNLITDGGSNGLNVTLRYLPSAFDAEQVHEFGAMFATILDAIGSSPHTRAGAVALLDQSRAAAVLAASRGPVVALPGESVADAVAAQVARTPDAVALVFEGRAVSYAEFGARVNVLARELISVGVGPDVAVGVCMDRGVELLVAVHAVVAAGGRYVPVDVGAPVERASVMLATAGAGVVLVAAGVRPAAVAEVAGVRLVEVDASGGVEVSAPGAAPVSDVDRRGRLRPDNGLYTLFTSGSTGVPKGVTVSHGSVLNRLRWGLDAFGWTVGDRVVLKTPYTFDVSVPELFGPVMAGATVLVARADGHRDPGYIADLIAGSGATSVHFVPSMLSVFLDVVGDERLRELTSLKWLFASGEALPPATVAAAHEVWPWVGIHNLFGPTEAAVEVGWADVSDAPEVVTIGKPVWNTSLLVLDDRLRPVPVGVPGELYLGGVQVARGYAKQAGLTAERFVADPFGASGARLYRTGDLVRRDGVGNVEYLGRTDFQVKLRGQRIELGEIESVIAGGPGVVHAAATVASAASGGEFLVGYVSPASVDVEAVKTHVAGKLPEYMCPSVWVLLDEVTLNSAGKLDRRALPAAELDAAQSEYVAPATDEERLLAEVFAEVLGVQRAFGVTEPFFEVGGNSLSAMRLVARVGAALDVEMSVRDVFEAPTVRALAELVAGRASALPPVSAVVPRPERIPLSFAQQRMWFLNQYDTASAAYNIPAGIRLTGALDIDALTAAFADVLGRHEVLRTRYPSDADGPRQEVLSVAAAVELFDWAEADRVEDLVRAATDGFDVSTGLPVRGRYRVVEPGVIDLVIVAHHIAFDGESTPIFTRDLLTAYLHRTDGSIPLPAPLAVQYADYALWQRDVFGPASDDSPLARQMRFWRDRLVELPSVTDLPMDRPRPPVVDQRGAVVAVTLEEDVAERFAAAAQRHGVTGFMLGHAALAITVARLAATDDVVIGSPIAGRTDPALDHLVGMFVNTLILRTPVDAAQPVAEFLASVRRIDVDAFANADVQFDDLIDEFAAERDSSHQPLVQIVYTHSDGAARADLAPIELPGFVAEPLASPDYVAKFELTVNVAERTGTSPMIAEFGYATALFDEPTVRRFAEVWRDVVAALAGDPTVAIGDLAVAPREESRTRLSRNSVGCTEPAADGGVTEPQLLVDVLAARPTDLNHPALVCAGEVLTYREFEQRTNRIARALIAAGAHPDDVIAVGLERSIESVLAVFGVIKSGGAYVPVDPAYPQDRIDYMLADSGARLGITNSATRPRLGASDCEWLMIDDLVESEQSGAPLSADDRPAQPHLDSLAYLVYTSGSTGRPKAVGVPNRGLANFVDQFREVSGAHAQSPDTRVLHVASPSFDASVLEMMWALGLGHTLVIAPATDYAGDALGRILDRDLVTDTLITPTVLTTVDPARGASIRNLVTGGETVSAELITRWAEAPGRRMYNFYGPSEATVWSLTGRSAPGRPVTIGHPVRGFAAYILDARLHPVPRGVVGELYLASDASLARGYLGRRGLTASSFVADPFSATPGARMYATGDLVRRNGDGQIEFAGRADDQVKINGQRVELGEIEAVLSELDGVDSVVVLGVRDERGRDRLVAYAVPTGEAELEEATLLNHAGERLAGHMVPHVVVMLSALPLTAGGKLDRKALPQPDFGERADTYAAPESSTEQTLASIVQSLLGLERVSVTDSFFALGGDSIMSIQLASAARANGLVLTPREIFENRTVRAMARATDAERAVLPMIAEPGPGVGMALPPLGRWLLEAAAGPDGDLSDFNQTAVLIAPEEATLDQLAELLAAIVGTHPMLAARLDDGPDGVTLIPGTPFDAGAAVAEHSVTAPVGTEAFDRALLSAHAAAAGRLNPSTGALIQLGVVRGEGAVRLVVVCHHLAVDAVSWPILVEDFVTGWAQTSAGQPVQLRAEQTSEAAWFAALADRALTAPESAYWAARAPRQVTDLGFGSAPSTRWSATSAVEVTIGPDVADALLTRTPGAFAGSIDDVLLGALAHAVRSWQQSRGIVDDAPVLVLAEGHGRYEEVLEAGPDPRRAELSRTVGWFTNIAPLALVPGADVIHAVKAAKQERLARPEHGLGFGFARYGGVAELADRPLPSIAFNYLGGRGGTVTSAGPESELLPMLPAPDAPVLPATVSGGIDLMSALTINASAHAGSRGSVITAEFRYPTDGAAEADIAELGARWNEALAELVRITDDADPGLSPADVPGAAVTQNELDLLASQYPGAQVWGLSPLQRGLYFHAVVAATSGLPDVYVVQAVLRLRGEFDIERLRRAAQELVAVHPVLRSAFRTTPEGSVVAVVPETIDVPWRVVDRTDLPGTGGAEYIRELKAREAVEPFDLAVPGLLRFVVVRNADVTDVLVTMHHLVIDGWSSPLVLADLLALYAVGAPYTSRAEGSADYAEYLRSLAARNVDEGLAAWRRILAPASGPTLLAPGAQAAPNAMPASFEMSVDGELSAQLDALARAHGVTVSTVLQLAWAVFLSTVTSNRVVTFGETVSGRPSDLVGIESVVGLFINTLPVVVDVDPHRSLADLLEELQAGKVSVLDHHHLGMPEIVAAADGDIGFDTLVVHESYPVDAESLESPGGSMAGAQMHIEGVEFTDATHYPLNLITSGDASGVHVALKYLPAAFSRDQVEGFGAILLRILHALGGQPETTVSDIALLGQDDVEAVLELAHGPVVSVPRVSVADAVAAQVARTPDAVALVFEGRAVSYAEFGARVNVLARELISVGVGPDVAVGVCMDRGVELLVAVHAVVAAGGRYVPVDVGAPVERASVMLATAGVGVVLVVAGVRPAAVAEVDGVRLVEVDSSGEVDWSVGPVSDVDRWGRLRPDSGLYTLFTSGSTGVPKGVTVSHAAVVNRLEWMARDYGLGAGARFLLKTPYTFDVSVWELFLPFVVGARLVVARPEGHRDPEYLASVIGAESVSVVHFVPSMLSVFCDVLGDRVAALVSLRSVFTSGEALVSATAQGLLARLPGVGLVNLYGPTEAAVDVTAASVLPGAGSVTIGRPVANTDAFVLDSRLCPVPVGVPGELYLGGVQVARGYAGQAGLTAERFVADPFGGVGARLYRTGDLVRWRADGEIEYLGRTDFQVKLRGQRVELGEIESVIAGAAGVVHAAAAVVSAVSGGELLVGYVWPASVDVEAVKSHVAGLLPEYMCPSVWVLLDEVTLNSAGKLDRRALPAPDFDASQNEYVAPETDTERVIAEVLAEVLGVKRVGVREHFFELGGNSLTAMRLAARLEAVTGQSISIRVLMGNPTVRDLATAIRLGDRGSAAVLVALRESGSAPPLFCIHPAGGLAWAFGGLAPYLVDRPIYGLQDPSVVNDESPADSIGDLAERYLREIRAVSPTGPYHLLGWSLGGAVAYEIASRLESSGESVAFLGLMDSVAGEELSAGVAASDDVSTTQLIDGLLGEWAGSVDIDPAESATNVAGMISTQLRNRGLENTDEVRRMLDSLVLAPRLLSQYHPPEIRGPIVYFTAIADKRAPERGADYWRARSGGAVHNVDVDAGHLELGRPEHMAEIGVVLARWLDEGADEAAGES
ncbi:amino acid adenylation domain-containing protein [Gordonia phosphorivorans]|uniref:Amino acid adenylation domain-containing protein n=1 Tax=Gordonia phosphorivorans TaxID=1056982 RepID=A0ABV6H4B0_9ACTN